MTTQEKPLPEGEGHEFNGVPPGADTSILNELLNSKPMVDMTDEELTEHLARLRQTMETPATLRSAMSTKVKAKAGPKGPSKAKTEGVDLLKQLGL
jgi:hypothetical protein